MDNLKEPEIDGDSEPWPCDSCGAEVSFEDKACSKCGADISEVADDEEDISEENPAIDRYLDLYGAARLQITIGTVVKVIGIVLGAGIFLIWLVIGLSGLTSTRQFETGVSVFFGGILGGAIFGAILGGFVFLFGVMISAQGQRLLAQADAAVHTSPFLTKEEKAKAMSLPYAH